MHVEGGKGGDECMKSVLKRLYKDEQGQSTVEYILILAVVVMVALKFKTTFQGQLEKIMEKVGGQIEQATSQ
jgi:Flp pilus assembly pilin Flp